MVPDYQDKRYKKSMEIMMAPSFDKQIDTAAEWLRQQIDFTPFAGIMTGTGLAQSFENIERVAQFTYTDIPYFPSPTVQSHPGELLLGKIADKAVMVFQGRLHLYESYEPWQVTFPVRLMRAMGVKNLFITNAAGGLHPAFLPGQIMVITDHINLTGSNPLIGPNNDQWGPRFPDMSRAYDLGFRKAASHTAKKCSLTIQKGVYAGLRGPSLETPAEIRFLQTIGADAVGFSTVCEVLAAIHAGMRVLGLSTITNLHTPDDPQPATLDEIITVAQKAAPQLALFISEVLMAS